jgi:FdhE protein
VLREQKRVYETLDSRPPAGAIDVDAGPLAECGVALLGAVAGRGPEPLAAQASELLTAGAAARQAAIVDHFRARSDREFFAKAIVQPYGQWLADACAKWPGSPSVAAGSRCPRCGGAPQLSVLEEANQATSDGGSRQLVCATCLTAWAFRRLVCPSCGEEDEQKLVYYRADTTSPAQSLDHVRIDACDSCGRYLKTIDLGRLGLAVPLVDEVAAAPLDLWAREHGYEKIELNLVGL